MFPPKGASFYAEAPFVCEKMSAIEVLGKIKYNIARNQNIRTNILRGGGLLEAWGIIYSLLLAVIYWGIRKKRNKKHLTQ
ncbi:MAG: hypothetical protein ACOX2N_05670 [Peptococcia bacterium]